MEPLTYQFGVDIFYYGHVRPMLVSCCPHPRCWHALLPSAGWMHAVQVHSYERTSPVHNYVADPW